MTFPSGEHASEHAGELLSALLDDELDVDTAQAVDRHVGRCPECRRELTDIDEARRSLREAAPVIAPPGVITGVVTRRRRATRRGTTLGFAAAAAAAVISLVFADPATVGSSTAQVGAGQKAEQEARSSRDRPSNIRRAELLAAAGNAAAADESRPSFADRAEEAVRDLLEFFG